MEEITNFISNVGFPIVICCYLLLDRKEITKAITELTLTMKEFTTRLENLEDKIKENKKL
ncbi:MAG: hypothetical protein ACRCX2_33420 [Paraclostridium sp.]